MALRSFLRSLSNFSAKSNSFSHIRANEDVPPNYLPVPALLDTVKLFAQVEKIVQNAGAEVKREEVYVWVARAQEAARAIQSYRIPLVEIKTNSLSVAVESFSRLNKKGRSIGQDEMFSALTYGEIGSERFHLASEIDNVQSLLIRTGFGEVDRNVLLRAVLTAANLDIYRTDWTRLGDQVKQDLRTQLPDAVTEASRGLQHGVAFLKGIGVLNARLLPYSMQLVALSAFFGRCEKPTPEQVAFLRRWFWVSSFSGWFGSGNAALMRRLVDEMRDVVAITPNPTALKNMDIDELALPVPLRFDMRSARVRALLCVLLSRRPMRTSGEELSLVDSADMLFSRGSESMSTICYTVASADLRRSPANRILDVAPDVSGQAKNWLTQISGPNRDAILLSHAIEPETLHLLASGNHDSFLERRLDFIGQIERDFMTSEGVSLPASYSPALSPIDADIFESVN